MSCDIAFLSIVIPVFNEGKNISRFLVQLNQQLIGVSKAIEIILVDGKSEDDTLNTIEKFIHTHSLLERSTVTWRVITCEAGRAKQMNKGAQLSHGQYLMFVHADTYLPSDIYHWCLHIEALQPVWGFFALSFTNPQFKFRCLSGLINTRSFMTRVCTGDQVQFFRRDQFILLGHFKPIALMEDVEISKRYRKHAKPCMWGTPIITSSRRWESKGFTKTVMLMWFLRLGYFLRIPIKSLAICYRHIR